MPVTAATSHPLQAHASSDSMLFSLVGDLALEFSAMAQKGLSWINSIKENYVALISTLHALYQGEI